jgi:transcription elongation factor GreA
MENILISKEKLADLKQQLVQLKNSLAKDNEEVTKMGGPMDSFKEAAAVQVALGAKKVKIKELQGIIQVAQVLPEYVPGDEIVIGKWFKVANANTTIRYRLVDPIEADPTTNFISANSPLGMAVYNKKSGSSFRLNSRDFKILTVE